MALFRKAALLRADVDRAASSFDDKTRAKRKNSIAHLSKLLAPDEHAERVEIDHFIPGGVIVCLTSKRVVRIEGINSIASLPLESISDISQGTVKGQPVVRIAHTHAGSGLISGQPMFCELRDPLTAASFIADIEAMRGGISAL